MKSIKNSKVFGTPFKQGRPRRKQQSPEQWVATQMKWYEAILYSDRQQVDDYPGELDFCGPCGQADGVWKAKPKKHSPQKQEGSFIPNAVTAMPPRGSPPSTKALDRRVSPFLASRRCSTAVFEVVDGPEPVEFSDQAVISAFIWRLDRVINHLREVQRRRQTKQYLRQRERRLAKKPSKPKKVRPPKPPKPPKTKKPRPLRKDEAKWIAYMAEVKQKRAEARAARALKKALAERKEEALE